jgi:hypothetical protein
LTLEAPQSRYKVVERDRRLVTIDTHTGQESGVTKGMADQSDVITAASNARRTGISQTTGSSRPSALGLGRSFVGPNAMNTKAPKMLILVCGAIILAGVLIVTNLWPIVVIAFVVKPVRDFFWPKILSAVARYLADDSAPTS